jgi:hypothetical protein
MKPFLSLDLKRTNIIKRMRARMEEFQSKLNFLPLVLVTQGICSYYSRILLLDTKTTAICGKNCAVYKTNM